jgi:hypothetical protein
LADRGNPNELSLPSEEDSTARFTYKGCLAAKMGVQRRRSRARISIEMEETKMKTKLILAALIAAMLATLAMACTDWKAIAALDAAIASYDRIIVEHETTLQTAIQLRGGKLWLKDPDTDLPHTVIDHEGDTMNDKKAALADKCQEDAR